MEGTKIKIHGKDYWRLVDPSKVEKARAEIIALGKLVLEDQKRNFKPIEMPK